MLLKSPILKSPKWLYTKHLQTIVPNLYRKVEGVLYNRERIETWDDDFLDLDWIPSRRAANVAKVER